MEYSTLLLSLFIIISILNKRSTSLSTLEQVDIESIWQGSSIVDAQLERFINGISVI